MARQSSPSPRTRRSNGPRQQGRRPGPTYGSSDLEARDPNGPRFQGHMDRSAEVTARRLIGLKECYDWRRNTIGIWDDHFVERAGRLEPMYLRHLCALPRMLPGLYKVQVDKWIEARLEIDGGWTFERAQGRASDFTNTPMEELFEDYAKWCFGDGTFGSFMETVPYGAFARHLVDHLGGKEEKRVRAVRAYDVTGQPISVRAACGVALRPDEQTSRS